jgi:hypothetical protein
MNKDREMGESGQLTQRINSHSKETKSYTKYGESPLS